MNASWLLGLYCGVILLASMAGGWLPLVLRPTHLRLQTYLSFASGAMLGAAMCHMMPEATRLAPDSWFHWTLAGLLALFFLERFFTFHHHEVAHAIADPDAAAEPGDAVDHAVHAHEHSEHSHHTGPLQSRLAWGTALVGLSIHTLTGGFALASAVAAESAAPGWVGLSVFLATVLHKPADSLTITSLMISGGTRLRKAHLVNFLFALVIPLGVILYFLTRDLVALERDAFTGNALGFSAGTFLSIALGDLMPELQFHSHDRVKLSCALLAGVAVMYASAALGG